MVNVFENVSLKPKSLYLNDQTFKNGVIVTGNFDYIKIRKCVFHCDNLTGLTIRSSEFFSPERIEIEDVEVKVSNGGGFPILISASNLPLNPIAELNMINVFVQGIGPVQPYNPACSLRSNSCDQFLIDNVSEIYIENCHSVFGGRDGFRIPNCEKVKFINCTASGNCGSGFAIGSNNKLSKNSKYFDNISNKCLDDISHAVFFRCRSLENYTNPHFRKDFSSGFHLQNVLNADFAYCSSRDHQFGIIHSVQDKNRNAQLKIENFESKDKFPVRLGNNIAIYSQFIKIEDDNS